MHGLKQAASVQDDWQLDLAGGFPVSRLTVELRWRRLTEEFSRLVRAASGPRAGILDLGGGSGEFFDALEGACGSYLLVEPSLSLLARFEPGPAKFACRGYGENLPCRSGRFDTVVIKAALDHCFDPQKVLTESFRVLREKGEIFILLTNDGAWYKRICRGQNAKRKLGCADHNFFFTVRQVTDLLEAAGFGEVRAYDFDYLRIPVAVENLVLDLIPAKLILAAMECLDRLGAGILPHGGGSFICRASKCKQ